MIKVTMLILLVLLLAGLGDARTPQKGDQVMIVYKTGGALLYGNITDIWDSFLCLSYTHVKLIDDNSTTIKDPPIDICIPLNKIEGIAWVVDPPNPPASTSSDAQLTKINSTLVSLPVTHH